MVDDRELTGPRAHRFVQDVLPLEPHRGTSVAQLVTEQGDRRSEHLLHEAEFLAALAEIRVGSQYPYQELQELWDKTLQGQAHGFPPGSSSPRVTHGVERDHEEIAERAEVIIAEALAALSKRGTSEDTADEGRAGATADHPGPAADGPVADDPVADGPADASRQVLVNTAPVARRGVPAYSAAAPRAGQEGVVVFRAGSRTTIENEALRAVIDETGALTSLADRTSGRDAIAPDQRGALLRLHGHTPEPRDGGGAGDIPDPGNVEQSSRRMAHDLDAPSGADVSEDRGGVRVSFTSSTPHGVDASAAEAAGIPSGAAAGAGSQIVTTFELRPGDESLQITLDIDWHEHGKGLTLEFPLDLRATHLRSEVQFGHIDRHVPAGTGREQARSETCAHRWVHVSEGDRGVALANDSTCGHDVLRSDRGADGGATTTARMTLLRTPEHPDPLADHGQHRLRVAVRPDAGVREAIEEGYLLNLPERYAPAAAAQRIAGPLIAVDVPSVRVETIKLAQDRSGDLVARMYEAEGAPAEAVVTPDPALAGGEVDVVDLLERPFSEDAQAFRSAMERTEDGGVRLRFRPFEIKTLRIERAA